jgi:hypothetical protein
MFPNNHVIDRLIQDRQQEIQSEVRGRDFDAAFPAPEARARLGQLIVLLVAAGWVISILV